jgi:hypothetical protein
VGLQAQVTSSPRHPKQPWAAFNVMHRYHGPHLFEKPQGQLNMLATTNLNAQQDAALAVVVIRALLDCCIAAVGTHVLGHQL